MTCTLELPPDTEARAQAQADAEGVAVEEYLLSLIKHNLPVAPPPPLGGARRFVRSTANTLRSCRA